MKYIPALQGLDKGGILCSGEFRVRVLCSVESLLIFQIRYVLYLATTERYLNVNQTT